MIFTVCDTSLPIFVLNLCITGFAHMGFGDSTWYSEDMPYLLGQAKPAHQQVSLEKSEKLLLRLSEATLIDNQTHL